MRRLNRLYFLYEAYDNYWDFTRPDQHNDIFEVVVDGEMSGGPLIDQYHRDIWTPEDGRHDECSGHARSDEHCGETVLCVRPSHQVLFNDVTALGAG